MYQVGEAAVLDGFATEKYDEGTAAMRMDIGRRLPEPVYMAVVFYDFIHLIDLSTTFVTIYLVIYAILFCLQSEIEDLFSILRRLRRRLMTWQTIKHVNSHQ